MDDGLAQAVMDVLREAHGPVAYILVGLSAALEPVFPPYPGDLVSMFGAFLAFSAGIHLVGIYLSMSVGSLVGGLLVYELGRFLGLRRDRWPRFLRGPKTERTLTAVLGLFDRHGSVLMAINRFWPTLRAVFFLAAGMAGLPRTHVAAFGGLSSLAWHGGIVLVAWTADRNFEAIVQFFERYTFTATVVVLAGLAIFLLYWLIRRGQGSLPRE
jgi:membrane protein DedA with SNARE-associated domain